MRKIDFIKRQAAEPSVTFRRLAVELNQIPYKKLYPADLRIGLLIQLAYVRASQGRFTYREPWEKGGYYLSEYKMEGAPYNLEHLRRIKLETLNLNIERFRKISETHYQELFMFFGASK